MSANYGAIEVNEKIVEEAKEGNINGVNFSDHYRRRRWWRVNQSALFGLGHVYNDLCAAMWFSYVMLFFQAVLEMKASLAGTMLLLAVLEMKASLAGTMLLLGQVVDALATPIVGVLADRFSTKKCWHLTGSVLVSLTFPLLFMRCWGCWPNTGLAYLSWWMPLYYATLIVFFQIGWAIVQISHLSMIPAISENQHVRAELTSIRYMASVMSSLMVYLVTWIVLRATNYSSSIGPTDDYKFRDVSLIISGIGVTSYIMFHIFFKLRHSKDIKTNGYSEQNGSSSLVTAESQDIKVTGRSKIMHFLTMPLLYHTSLLYVFSRLYWALSLVYVPLFLEERLSVNPTQGSELIASVPLVLYLSSFVISLILKSKISKCGNQIAYLLGSIMSLISSMWIALAIDPQASIVQIYLVATLIGAGSSITMVSSLCVTADLIGPHAHQGAAVYSIVTFLDKLVTGIAVVAIQS
ncbi:MFS/sugar transport protein domain-containing protein [Phthorimaea operculella]|nr:MFS/sugar transport protein domain-containing protein [Phthorimaea operculella]